MLVQQQGTCSRCALLSRESRKDPYSSPYIIPVFIAISLPTKEQGDQAVVLRLCRGPRGSTLNTAKLLLIEQQISVILYSASLIITHSLKAKPAVSACMRL